MTILLTNDDGINADGIRATAAALARDNDLVVAAPKSQMSGVGCGLTIEGSINVIRRKIESDVRAFEIEGTPADCVKLAVTSLLDEKPSLVVSGINLGPNTGINVFYSGTVAGALEGALNGIPSIAVSLATFINPDFSSPARITAELVKKFIRSGIPDKSVINVNIPAVPDEKIEGVRVTGHGWGRYLDFYEKSSTGDDGTLCYKLTGDVYLPDQLDKNEDWALKNNFISVTPLFLDLTDHNFLDELKSILDYTKI